jgi:hypothetical protein
VAPDVTGDVALGEPFRGAAGQIVTGPFCVSTLAHRPMIAPIADREKPLGIGLISRKPPRVGQF